MRHKSIASSLAFLCSLVTFSPVTAEAADYSNPILHEVRIDDDLMQATLTWSTSPTSDADDIDDYAYTTDGMTFTSLYGAFDSESLTESQTLTIRIANRANAKTQIFAIGKVRDYRVSSISNIIRAKISEQPIPITIQFAGQVENSLTYKISNYNRLAVANGAIRYKVTQIKASNNSKVRVSLSDDTISVYNFIANENIAFRVVKYVNLCDGFSPYLWCPYNSKVETKVDWKLFTTVIKK
jgi:hypothetical protein